MNTKFLTLTPRLVHGLAATGTLTVDPGSTRLGNRLHRACERVAAALRPASVRSLHPSEINLARLPRL